MYLLKIPKSRVGCLIGKKGITKRLIEKNTKSSIRVNKEGEVEINGEGYEGYICEKIVKAIGRGFNPEVALNLMQENYGFEVIDIRDYSGKSKKKFYRIKSRLIGEGGRSRRVIERLTNCNICIFGKTASLIGEFENLSIALKGVEKLLRGSPHGSVYGFLEREIKKVRKENKMRR